MLHRVDFSHDVSQMGHLEPMPHTRDTNCHTHPRLFSLPRRPETPEDTALFIPDTKRDGSILPQCHDGDGADDFDTFVGGGPDGGEGFSIIGVTRDLPDADEREESTENTRDHRYRSFRLIRS